MKFSTTVDVTNAVLAGLLVTLAGCPEPTRPGDDDDAVDDDASGDDDGTEDDDTTADDDSASDDDITGDDDSSGDDDTGAPSACEGESADLVVPLDAPSIQNALNLAIDGDRICIEPGTYFEQLDFLGKEVEIYGVAGAEQTIISGGGVGPVVRFAGEEGEAAVLRGFTITDGDAYEGGGILIQNSSPTLKNLIVRSNNAQEYGGGMFVTNGQPQVESAMFSSNYAYASGGGVRLDTSSMSFKDVQFVENASYSGGAISSRSSSVTIDNAQFRGNWTACDGGALHVTLSELGVAHALFLGNSADHEGGALALDASTVTASQILLVGNISGHEGGAIDHSSWTGPADLSLANATFIVNQSAGVGGAIAGWADVPVLLTNAIVVRNVGDPCGGIEGGQLVEAGFTDLWGNLETDYCDGWFFYHGGPDGNVILAPEFVDTTGVDPATWDLHLDITSPLVDAGDPALLDPDGSISDMGAFGGPGADGWDLDGDGYPSWWQPGPYDYAVYPALGLDCDDLDPSVFPGSGC